MKEIANRASWTLKTRKFNFDWGHWTIVVVVVAVAVAVAVCRGGGGGGVSFLSKDF